MDMILSEALIAINEITRHGDFALVQWVLSKMPRTPGTQGDENEAHDIGTIQAHVTAPTAFAMQSKYRFIARKSYQVGLWRENAASDTTQFETCSRSVPFRRYHQLLLSRPNRRIRDPMVYWK